MKTIFFNSRSLILCGEDRPGDEDPGAVIMVDNGEEALSEAIRTIDTNESISRLYILCQNIEDTYNRLRTRFTEIDAAGGLVRDSNGQYLLILRNGIWDLPKGKREKGEDVAQTAVREVMEETGIPAPEEGRLICVTDHTYHRDGQFVLKHTHWYAMRLTQPCSTKPQTEEGITQTAWVSAAELPGYAEQTFPSIREVLHSAGLLQELR